MIPSYHLCCSFCLAALRRYVPPEANGIRDGDPCEYCDRGRPYTWAIALTDKEVELLSSYGWFDGTDDPDNTLIDDPLNKKEQSELLVLECDPDTNEGYEVGTEGWYRWGHYLQLAYRHHPDERLLHLLERRKAEWARHQEWKERH